MFSKSRRAEPRGSQYKNARKRPAEAPLPVAKQMATLQWVPSVGQKTDPNTGKPVGERFAGRKRENKIKYIN